MKKRPYKISFYGRAALPSMSEVLAVFSWRVIRAESLSAAIVLALAETGDAGRWQWALVKYDPSPTCPNTTVHALRLKYEGGAA